MEPRVSFVDDESSVRNAIARLLGAAGLTVMVYASAQEYLDQIKPDEPGCLVLDLSMPVTTGLDLQKMLRSMNDSRPIIFLSGQAEIPDSVQAMKSGAVEFLTKPVDEAVLLAAVRRAFEIDRLERARRAELAAIRSNLQTLTPRELEVFRHVVSGQANKLIAYELGTVEKTIKVHRAHVMQKMQVKSLADLVRLAVRLEIVGPS